MKRFRVFRAPLQLTVFDMNYRKPYEVTKRTVYEYQVDEFNYIHPKKNQSENA
ncbi:hypothetical protein ACTMNS_06990 [Staphylococcus haemolyticus]